MSSAKMASAIDVRIDDVGSILKFRIGLPLGENSAGFFGESVRVASGVDTEIPYRVRIVDRGVIAATLFADTVSDAQVSELRLSEKRKQQCIPFFRGTCQKGVQCRYEHQVDNEGRPVPVGPEILQRFDEAVKRFNERKAQAKAKAVPRGGFGVAASMIVLGIQESMKGARYYAMVDSIMPMQFSAIGFVGFSFFWGGGVGLSSGAP